MVGRQTPIGILATLVAATGLLACTITTEVAPPDTSRKVRTTKKSPSPSAQPTEAGSEPSAAPTVAPTKMPFPTLPPAMPTRAPSVAPSVAPSAFFTAAPTTSPVATTSATPFFQGTTPPSAAPSAAASPSASPFVQSSAPAPSGQTLILSGNIYDEEGATIDFALITVKSLDASVPYTATATSQAGSWVVNNVPEGANVEILVSKDGWTTRRRVGSFQQQAVGTRNVVNFGAAGGFADNEDDDPTGQAYFIADYPEVVSTSPDDDAFVTDASTLIYSLTFSEPLTAASRDAVEDSLRIWPANSLAAGGAAVANLDDLSDDAFGPDGDAISAALPGDGRIAADNLPYVIEEGTSFGGSTRAKATASWNAEGTRVTLTFNAPLLTGSADSADYQVGFAFGGEAVGIEDEDGNPLGTGTDGMLDSYAGLAAGELIRNVFKEPDLALGTPGADRVGDRNWSTTHDTVRTFTVEEDDITPKLTAVDVTEEGSDVRIELTFSEPMAAFDGSLLGHTGPGTRGPGTDFIANYSFALSDVSDGLNDLDLGGDGVAVVVTAQGATVGVGERDLRAATDLLAADPGLAETEFSFDPGSVVASFEDFTAPGQIAVEVDEDNPTTLFLWINDRASYFNSVGQIKARAEDVADPAGNVIGDLAADANVVEAVL